MTKTSILKDRQGNELLPITTTDCVITSSGKSLKEVYATKQYADEAAADILNSSPEQLQVINTLGEKLADDENVASAVTKTVADAKMQLFIDMWNEACKVKIAGEIEYTVYGSYNQDTGLFDLYDMSFTFEEALHIFLVCGNTLKCCATYESMYANSPISAILPIYMDVNNGGGKNFKTAFYQTAAEVICFHKGLFASDMNSTFYNARKLRKIIGIIYSTQSSRTNMTNAFLLCNSLENVFIENIGMDINFKDSPKLDFDTFSYLINTKNNSKAVTITVHPDVYSKLTEGEEEWLALNELAISKQITFATV